MTIAIAALLVGCGSNSDGSGSDGYEVRADTTVTVAEPPLTKRQFVARVNKLCREAWDTVHDNWDVHVSAQEPELKGRERFQEAVRASLLAGIDFHIFDGIYDLGAPPGEERQIEEIIGPFQLAVELGQMERWKADSIADVAAQFERYNGRASRYGLDDCLVGKSNLRGLEI